MYCMDKIEFRIFKIRSDFSVSPIMFPKIKYFKIVKSWQTNIYFLSIFY